MTLLYTSPRFLDHDTGPHPERSERLIATVAQLESSGVADRCQQTSWRPIPPERLARVHSLEYAQRVATFAQQGGGNLDPDTVVSPDSYDVALLAAGAVCDAVERVVNTDEKNALCLVRPPGHHALADRAMGFCLFNNVATGAKLATSELSLDRVLIVDWDVHHGNGTQAMFWDDPQVAFFSIHRWPFYPGTGRADETGGGKAPGTIRNLPTEFGTPRRQYLDTFTRELEDFATKNKPQLILISAGFDAHREDPVGSLGLATEDFAELTQIVLDLAAVHCSGRVVSVLEGGYHPQRLAESVELHLGMMLDCEAD